MKPLILGVGNILLGDEGVGVRIAQALENRSEILPNFDVVDGGTCGMELLDKMAKLKIIKPLYHRLGMLALVTKMMKWGLMSFPSSVHL